MSRDGYSPEELAAFDSLDESSPDDLRAAGWAVAVHNDYRLDGEPNTFWLLTKGDRCIKGEGRTDADALNAARAAMRAEPETPGERLLREGYTRLAAGSADQNAGVVLYGRELAPSERLRFSCSGWPPCGDPDCTRCDAIRQGTEDLSGFTELKSRLSRSVPFVFDQLNQGQLIAMLRELDAENMKMQRNLMSYWAACGGVPEIKPEAQAELYARLQLLDSPPPLKAIETLHRFLNDNGAASSKLPGTARAALAEIESYIRAVSGKPPSGQ